MKIQHQCGAARQAALEAVIAEHRLPPGRRTPLDSAYRATGGDPGAARRARPAGDLDIGADLAQLAAQLEALAVDQAALAEMVAGIAVEDPAINAALAAITERQAALEAVIADLAAAPAPDAGQADALAALTEQLAAIDARLDELAQPVELDIGADLAPLAAQLEALAVDQAILAELVAGLGVEDPAINAVLAAIQARLDELAQPVDLDIGADLAQLAAQLEALVADQATLAELVAVIAAEDPAINAALAAIDARLDELVQPVEIDIGANLAPLAAQLEALAVDQAALAEMVAGIAVEDPAINAALAAITERQAALEAVIADLAAAPAPDAGQADALAALTEQLVAIQARLDELAQPVDLDIGADLAQLAGSASRRSSSIRQHWPSWWP